MIIPKNILINICLYLIMATHSYSSFGWVKTSLPKLLSIRTYPETIYIGNIGSVQQVLVLGKYDDGLEREVTTSVNFKNFDASVLKINQTGKITPQKPGNTVIKAVFQNLSANVEVQVKGLNEQNQPNFSWDIEKILTRRGCNDSNCHGGVKGKGGFKLSLNGIFPRKDFRWIVKGGTYQVLSSDPGKQIPRIDLEDPKKSLLLLKPTLSLPHGGGHQFQVNSEDYQIILNWIRKGALFEEITGNQSKILNIEVYPNELVMDRKGKQQLLVTASMQNQIKENITEQVRYSANNPEVARVTINGQVKAVQPGETFITIQTAGWIKIIPINVIKSPINHYPSVPKNNFIDKLVFNKLRKLHIIPSDLSSDGEFLRRVCLDLTGTLPLPNRTKEFINNRDPKKREKLIDLLIKTPEFVDYWTFRFAELLRVSLFQNGINLRWTESYWEWIRNHVASNTPYDKIAKERISAIGYSPPSRHFLPNGEVRYPENKMAEEFRVFMGRRLDCAQCHDHPFEFWSQNQFWELAAFFGRMNLVGGRGEEIGTVIYEDPTGQEIDLFQKGKSRKVLHPRTGKEVLPKFLDGPPLSQNELADPRLHLAKWIISHPYFSQAAVNRIWSYFFNRGIVEPVDDFRVANPPTNPKLLSALANNFRKNGYNLQHFIRVIVNSRTYQLTSQPNSNNRDDRTNYSHSLPRTLDAEVLFDAISSVINVPLIFQQDSYDSGEGMLPPGTRAINVKMPDLFRSRILDIYGKSLRSMLPEKRPQANLGRALHSLAGSTFTRKLSQTKGRINLLLKAGLSDNKIIEDLYLRTIVRRPTQEEKTKLNTMITGRTSRKSALEDLLWGLLNSPEFYNNH